MLNDTESSTAFWSSVQDALFQAIQIIDIRLALLIGVAAFMLAVGFDSSGNQAAAADLAPGAAPVPVMVSASFDSGVESARFQSVNPVSDAQLATARRLRHGTLTSAILTNNRLTEAHFFTELPADQ